MNKLSNIELFYAPSQNFTPDKAVLPAEEFKHAVRVMRHSAGDTLYITNGGGSIFETRIEHIGKDSLIAGITNSFNYENRYRNLVFCIPKLKNPERFEFALEKCAELGITRFIVLETRRSFTKGDKTERWNKILLAAMKQSLRSWLPRIEGVMNIKELSKLNGTKIIFEQNAEEHFDVYSIDNTTDNFFVFGPEGGLDETEFNLFPYKAYRLADNRLRSETAVIKCAALLK